MKELSGEKDEKRIIWLDFVKFIAIFMMIAVHCTDNVTPAERSEPWYNLWGSVYASSHTSVCNGNRSIAFACRAEYFCFL